MRQCTECRVRKNVTGSREDILTDKLRETLQKRKSKVTTLDQFACLDLPFTRPAVLRGAALLVLFPSQQTMHLRPPIVANTIDAQVGVVSCPHWIVSLMTI